MAGVVKVKAVAAACHTVEIIAPMTYSPASLEIKAGDTVEWVSKDDSEPHTVTSDDGNSFASGNMSQNDKFEHTFATAGDFPYHCEVHGPIMAGIIKVT
jgi:plastocyanin